MGPIFGTPKASTQEETKAQRPEVTAHDKAVLDLKITRDKIQKYKKRLEGEIRVYIVNSKALMKEGKKDKALLFVKMKKYKENQVSNLEKQLNNVEEMLNTVVSAEMNVRVLNAISAGNKELKRLTEEMPLDKAEKILEETREAKATVDEISAMFAQSLTDEDNADADAEMEEMLREINLVDNLPEAPTTKPKINTPIEPEKSKSMVPV